MLFFTTVLATPDPILDRQMKQSQTKFDPKYKEHNDFMTEIHGKIAAMCLHHHISMNDTQITHILNKTTEVLTQTPFEEDPSRSAAYIGKTKWAVPNYKDAFAIANAMRLLTAEIGSLDTNAIVDSIVKIYQNPKIKGRYVRLFRPLMIALKDLKQKYKLTNDALQESVIEFTKEELQDKPSMYLDTFYQELRNDDKS